MVELYYDGTTQPKGVYEVKDDVARELIKQKHWVYNNLRTEEVIVEEVKPVIKTKPIEKSKYS